MHLKKLTKLPFLFKWIFSVFMDNYKSYTLPFKAIIITILLLHSYLRFNFDFAIFRNEADIFRITSYFSWSIYIAESYCSSVTNVNKSGVTPHKSIQHPRRLPRFRNLAVFKYKHIYRFTLAV